MNNSRISLYWTLLIVGLALVILQLYYYFTTKAIDTSILKNNAVAYKIGFYIGHYAFITVAIIIGSTLIIWGVKGLLSQSEKAKSN